MVDKGLKEVCDSRRRLLAAFSSGYRPDFISVRMDALMSAAVIFTLIRKGGRGEPCRHAKPCRQGVSASHGPDPRANLASSVRS